MHLTLEQWSFVAIIAAALTPVVHTVYQWAVRVDTAATNHIPHIYAILRRMCDHLGIEYIDLEGDIETHKARDRNRD